jgi:hypothetical protein
MLFAINDVRHLIIHQFVYHCKIGIIEENCTYYSYAREIAGANPVQN